MRLIVNIPAYNEDEKIGQTIQRIPRTFDGITEVLVQVIDDGSKDRTIEVSREAGADFVYTNGVNRGVGKTFRHAVERALENQADIMVNIDADGQFDPVDIEKLIRPILNHTADMVSADRFTLSTAENIPWIKNVLNRFAARLIGGFMNATIPDLTCGFRAHSRETLLRLNLPGDFTYTQEVIIDVLGKNLKLAFVPVTVTYFADRKSRVVKSIFGYINNSFRIILKAVRDVRPMKFFGVPGLVLMLISLTLFIAFLFNYFQDWKITPYRNYLISSLATFVIGLQFFVFSLIADMIKTNRRLTEDMMYLAKKERYEKR
jgi:glycosyltransferase involved in cell wall biosynthesis